MPIRQKPTLKESRTPKQEIVALKAAMDQKRGYLRYLKGRHNDPTPLEAEIKRHEEHAAEHLAKAERLRKILADVPAELAKAQAELSVLQAKLSQLDPTPLSDIQLRLANLEAALAAKGITL